MKYYEDLLKEKSLDELLQESQSQMLQQKPLEIMVSNEIRDQGLEVMTKTSEGDKSYEAMRVIGGKSVEYLGGFVHGFFEGCFGIPTLVRRRNQEGNEESESHEIGYLFGSGLPILPTIFSIGFVPIFGYYKLIAEYPTVGWGLLGTQITTNALSGLYEWFRYEKNKLKQKGEIKDGKS